MNALLNPARVFAEQLPPHGNIPNSHLPLLVYEHAVRLESDDPATIFEELFEENGWGDTWRNGIYNYHHYHSTAHEVLGVYCGSASVQLGGEGGIIKRVNAGDVIIIPAGVGHKNLGASQDFGVVGAYPDGQKWDMLTGKPDERPKAEANIKRVPLPKLDPVQGKNGPLLKYWR
jgi:uncharacterized protein YjlB